MAIETIKTSLYTKLESLAGLPQIRYSNVDGVLPTGQYIRPDVLPATTDPVGIETTDRESGIFQVSIFTTKGGGELEAARITQILLSGFPRNLQLNGVRFDRTGSVGASLFEGSWQITPVSFIYINIS